MMVYVYKQFVKFTFFHVSKYTLQISESNRNQNQRAPPFNLYWKLNLKPPGLNNPFLK